MTTKPKKSKKVKPSINQACMAALKEAPEITIDEMMARLDKLALKAARKAVQWRLSNMRRFGDLAEMRKFRAKAKTKKAVAHAQRRTPRRAARAS